MTVVRTVNVALRQTQLREKKITNIKCDYLEAGYNTLQDVFLW